MEEVSTWSPSTLDGGEAERSGVQSRTGSDARTPCGVLINTLTSYSLFGANPLICNIVQSARMKRGMKSGMKRVKNRGNTGSTRAKKRKKARLAYRCATRQRVFCIMDHLQLAGAHDGAIHDDAYELVVVGGPRGSRVGRTGRHAVTPLQRHARVRDGVQDERKAVGLDRPRANKGRNAFQVILEISRQKRSAKKEGRERRRTWAGR